MKKLLFTFLFLTLGTAWGGTWEDGAAAYERNDYATAIKLWRPLADTGNANAQLKLGYMYEQGHGVLQNYKEAVKWYKLAAEQGDVRAQFSLAYMYSDGQGVPQDYARAHMWWNIASAAGYDFFTAENRDRVAKKMTSQQIEKAQEMAKACQARNLKGC